jgi:hypothetical protein
LTSIGRLVPSISLSVTTLADAAREMDRPQFASAEAVPVHLRQNKIASALFEPVLPQAKFKPKGGGNGSEEAL